VNFWADFEQRIIDGQQTSSKTIVGLYVSRLKDRTSNTCCNFWHRALFR